MVTTLHVKFPDAWPGWNIHECTLTSAVYESDSQSSESDSGSSTDAELEVGTVTVDPKALSDYYSDTPVFRGNLQRPFCPYEKTTVVLKFAMRSDLISDLVEETEMYLGPLEPLQGSAVPRFYGLYTGTENDQDIACLVLEYCGESITKRFSLLPMNLRVRILEHLGEIHRQGFLHGDFAERNVLHKNGEVRLIDFDRTIPDHHCRCDMNFHAGETTPERGGFGCDYLWDIALHNMKIWKS
ncbi:hypothetical protein BDN70DRAFT_834830 [Pholiota conissans]|uniref:Non-specific serine/threonine protein kinase n=1 Tax=Pholiota conissans TaxID=109636 RepID=A0A9P5Z0F2_9AGAR|nr:hypothetical protein BDN70DRAFT_834830 [Pholiota conissans]